MNSKLDINTALKLCVIVALLSVGFSAAYYYLFFLPHTGELKIAKQTRAEALEQIIKCKDNTEKLEKKDDQDAPPGFVYLPREHSFSNKLNTCLNAVHIIIGKDWVIKQIWDIYRDQLLVVYHIKGKEVLTEMSSVNSEEEFQRKKNELFSDTF